MSERSTRQAREALRQADREARRFGHEYVGTEHILLGLLKEETGVAAFVLRDQDVDLRKVRLMVETNVQAGPDGNPLVLRDRPRTPRARKAIEYAVEEARRLKHDYLGTEHLLLGLIREEEGVAAQVLMNLGVRLEEARAAVERELNRQVVDPAWLWRNDGSADRVARRVADDRDWAALPVLADALEDAGCEDREVLAHLRQGARHGCPAWRGHGCWVLDRLLGPRTEEAAGPPPPVKKWWHFWK